MTAESTADLRAVFASLRTRLADVPREALGDLQEGRRFLGIPRAPRIVTVGSAWHLGVLLVTDDGVAATGDIVRSREEVRRGFTSETQRHRAELEGAAFRGGIVEGQAVHVGWQRIDLEAIDESSSPIALVDGVAWVRWSAAGGFVPLQQYVDERVDLLEHPPERA